MLQHLYEFNPRKSFRRPTLTRVSISQKLKDNQGVKIYNIFYLISKICYTFLHNSVASNREDSADKVLGDFTAAGGTAAWKIANVVSGKCRLTIARADLQKF